MQREVILSNNRCKPSLKYNNFHFLFKSMGKIACGFRCATPKCYASISLKVESNEILLPYVILNLNEKHNEKCIQKPESFFEIRKILSQVRTEIVENPTKPVQQIFESHRSAHRANSEMTLPDYNVIKSIHNKNK